jgi:hypothetical protein
MRRSGWGKKSVELAWVSLKAVRGAAAVQSHRLVHAVHANCNTPLLYQPHHHHPPHPPPHPHNRRTSQPAVGRATPSSLSPAILRGLLLPCPPSPPLPPPLLICPATLTFAFRSSHPVKVVSRWAATASPPATKLSTLAATAASAEVRVADVASASSARLPTDVANAARLQHRGASHKGVPGGGVWARWRRCHSHQPATATCGGRDVGVCEWACGVNWWWWGRGRGGGVGCGGRGKGGREGRLPSMRHGPGRLQLHHLVTSARSRCHQAGTRHTWARWARYPPLLLLLLVLLQGELQGVEALRRLLHKALSGFFVGCLHRGLAL